MAVYVRIYVEYFYVKCFFYIYDFIIIITVPFIGVTVFGVRLLKK